MSTIVPFKQYKKILGLALVGLVSCTADVCEYFGSGSPECPQLKINLIPPSSNILSLRQDTRIEFRVDHSAFPLQKPLTIVLKQAKEIPLSGCDSDYHCLVNITLQDLKEFVPGEAQIISNQGNLQQGSLPVVIKDPAFDFSDPAEVKPLPMLSMAEVTEVELANVGIANRKLAFSRQYRGKDRYYYAEIFIAKYDNISNASPSNIFGSVPVIVSFSDTQYTVAKPTNAIPPKDYIIYQCSVDVIPCANTIGNNISLTNAMVPPLMTSLKVSPKSEALFVVGADFSIYTSTTSMVSSPLVLLSTTPFETSPMGMLITPLSATSLIASAKNPMKTMKFTSTGTQWDGADLALSGTLSIDAIGAGALATDGARSDLAVGSGTKITFFKNKGGDTFESIQPGLALPADAGTIRAIAIGDLDGKSGNDLAIITKDKLYVAFHQ